MVIKILGPGVGGKKSKSINGGSGGTFIWHLRDVKILQ